MSADPSKPSGSSQRPSGSSWRDRDRDRNKERNKYNDRDSRRGGNWDRDWDGRGIRSPSPLAPPSKRARTEGSRKGKESVHDEVELGVETKTHNIGDDFIPFEAFNGETFSEEVKQSGKGREAEREWDKGQLPRYDNRLSRGTKRKHDDLSDDDNHGRRRTGWQVPSRSAPWIANVDWGNCRNVAEVLHCEVAAFVHYMSPTPVEDEIRSLIVRLVSREIISAFPDARISPFGSYETKLYLPSGDIDLVVDSERMAYSDKVHVLYALANTLKRARITSKVTVISKAKVPIIKFVTTYGRLNVDISVNQGNGVTAGNIINGFLRDMRGCGFALRSLVMVVKAFLCQREMNEVYTGGLGSYSIVCLAISFLQMHPKIRRGEINAEQNLGVLVMEFFEFYGCYFNYEEVGISIRNGGSYFSKHQRGWYDTMKCNLLSIEDPIDPTNDISKGSYGIAKVRQTFSGAYEIMKATAYTRASILNSRREGRNYPLRQGYDPRDMSILSTILGVTQETINNRRLLQEVYDRRTLHELLGVAEARSFRPPLGIVDYGLSEGEMDLESDEDDDARLRDHENSDEDGKYHIQRRRPGHGDASNHFDAPYTTDGDEAHDEQERTL